jgi:hypothetical protein
MDAGGRYVVAVSEVKQFPVQIYSGYVYNGHYPTDASVRSDVAVMYRYDNGCGRWQKTSGYSTLVRKSLTGIISVTLPRSHAPRGRPLDLESEPGGLVIYNI